MTCLIKFLAAPHWQEPSAKALCGGAFALDRAMAALKQLHGGDQKPERRDAKWSAYRANKSDKYTAEDFEEDWCEEAFEEEAYYEEEDEWLDDDEVPEDLGGAYDVAEEAFAIGQDARR